MINMTKILFCEHCKEEKEILYQAPTQVSVNGNTPFSLLKSPLICGDCFPNHLNLLDKVFIAVQKNREKSC